MLSKSLDWWGWQKVVAAILDGYRIAQPDFPDSIVDSQDLASTGLVSTFFVIAK